MGIVCLITLWDYDVEHYAHDILVILIVIIRVVFSKTKRENKREQFHTCFPHT